MNVLTTEAGNITVINGNMNSSMAQQRNKMSEVNRT